MTSKIEPVERLTRPIAGIEHRTAKEVFDIMSDRIRSALVETAQPVSVPDDGWKPTHRHKKRGSTYTVIAEGRLEVDGDLDYERVVIYRGEDGQVWAQPKYEFEDGRFEALPPAPANGGDDLETGEPSEGPVSTYRYGGDHG